MTPKECEEAVSHPGKFEGEARYIPHFYELMLDGYGEVELDKYNLEIYAFSVDDEDIRLFPELEDETIIRFYIRDDGFVCEI